MALNRSDKYPGRFLAPTTAHPQGAFKNRTSPTAQDGSYLEADWANDMSGFFEAVLSNANLTPNGNVDSAVDSQVFTALQKLGLRVSGNQVFTASGSFTVPFGVTKIYITAAAGGGGGGGSGGAVNNTSFGGGGGGGGAGQFVIKQSFSVTPGQTIGITPGSPGTAGLANSATAGQGFNGGNGGTTTVGSLLVLSGGGFGGGGGFGSNVAVGGTPGSGYPNGASGNDGSLNFATGLGGAGASGLFGGGGSGGKASRGTFSSMLAASGFGGGGGGGGGIYPNGDASGIAGNNGGAGAPGIVIIEW